jgi:hypothetical protein
MSPVISASGDRAKASGATRAKASGDRAKASGATRAKASGDRAKASGADLKASGATRAKASGATRAKASTSGTDYRKISAVGSKRHTNPRARRPITAGMYGGLEGYPLHTIPETSSRHSAIQKLKIRQRNRDTGNAHVVHNDGLNNDELTHNVVMTYLTLWINALKYHRKNNSTNDHAKFVEAMVDILKEPMLWDGSDAEKIKDYLNMRSIKINHYPWNQSYDPIKVAKLIVVLHNMGSANQDLRNVLFNYYAWNPPDLSMLWSDDEQ